LLNLNFNHSFNQIYINTKSISTKNAFCKTTCFQTTKATTIPNTVTPTHMNNNLFLFWLVAPHICVWLIHFLSVSPTHLIGLTISFMILWYFSFLFFFWYFSFIFIVWIGKHNNYKEFKNNILLNKKCKVESVYMLLLKF
jgi:hypothetical protein